MNALQIYRYNGTPIEFELIDGQLYANATEMCQAFGKRINDWKGKASTLRYVSALEAKPEITVSLIISRKGGVSAGGSTWIHEKLILKLAQWLDVDFELWCDERIAEVLKTGYTSIAKPTTPGELILHLAQQNLENERRLAQVEAEQAEVKAEQADQRESIRMLEAKTTTIPDYFTVAGYANLNRISVGLKVASSVGQRASRICKERGIPTESCPDPRFGVVNMYPSNVLREVFSQPIR